MRLSATADQLRKIPRCDVLQWQSLEVRPEGISYRVRDKRHNIVVTGYGADWPKHRAQHICLMAVAKPKSKDELARQFKINPEINEKLEAFMKAESDLVTYVKELPREQLERKFLLRKMQDVEQRQGYSAKVKDWLDQPEQADLVKSMKSTISPNMKPERQEAVLITQAKNHIRNNKIKIS